MSRFDAAIEERKLDPFCVEKNLKCWASSRIVSRGRDYYRRGKVLAIESSEEGLVEASVEGSADRPYRVEVRFDAGGMPRSRCDCPYDWEPLCKHAVAALIAWQQDETGSDPDLGPLPKDAPVTPEDGTGWLRYIEELATIERKDRESRALEQGLRVLGRPAGGVLGTYRVGSAAPSRKGEAYLVTVRDPDWRHVSCGCVDFRVNELGTCKHVERVRRLLGRSGAAQLAAADRASRQAWAYLASRPSHERSVGPLDEVRFYIPPSLRSRVPSWLGEHLDAEGYLLDGGDPNRARQDFEGMLQKLSSKGIRIHADPLVSRAFEQEESRLAWERRMAQVSNNPEGHPAWRRSVAAMHLRLHPYQREGILFAAAKRRAFIGDDMGLGKTVQGIGTALLLRELGAVKRALIVCPASLKEQWRREIERACGQGGGPPTQAATVIAGPAKERDRQYRNLEGLFAVVNYELLYRDLDSVLKLKPDLVILDEAQRIKNWETKIAQTMRRLDSPFRLVLTGTPLENRLSELHGILEFLDPKALGAPWKLIGTYARLNEEGRITGYLRLDQLRSRIGRFLIRRTRQEVLSQLPKRTDNHFWTPITQDQQAVHDELAMYVSRIIQKWQRFKRLTREDMQRLFMLLTTMRIVCNAYGQYDWKKLQDAVLSARKLSGELKTRIGSPKLEEFSRVLADLLAVPGQKVVVFSSWERMLRLAELYAREAIEASGSRAVFFTGSLSLRKREAQIRRFSSDPACRVFFSTDAGGVGLNLQHAANCVVNLEIPWNPSVLEQRIARVHRMGQKKSVQVVNMVSSECIEERILALVGQKKALFAGVFDPNAKEVRFTPEQTASFMDKMKAVVPLAADARAEAEGASRAEEPLPDAIAEAARDAVAAPAPDGADGTSGPLFPATVSQASGSNAAAVSETTGVSGALQTQAASTQLLSTESSAAQLDLGPALSILAQLLGQDRPKPAAAVAHIREDREGVHVSLPRPAVDLLRGLKPLLQGLLALADSPGAREDARK